MKSYFGELFDICENRHGGNHESKLVWSSIKAGLPQARQAALDYIAAQGARGSTAQEYADFMGVSINTVSGRFSELKRDGLIEKTGTRDRGGVYVARNHNE